MFCQAVWNLEHSSISVPEQTTLKLVAGALFTCCIYDIPTEDALQLMLPNLT